MNVETYTVTIEYGDSIEQHEVDNIMSGVMHDVDAGLFDLTSVTDSYRIVLNGVTQFEFEGEPE